MEDLQDIELGQMKSQVLIAFMLARLPAEYASLCQSIDESASTTTPEDVKHRILDANNRNNRRGNAEIEQDGSQTVPGFFSRNSNGGSRSQLRGQYRGRRGYPNCGKN